MAFGNNCAMAGRPLSIAIGTAASGSSNMLNTMTIMSEAPKPTNPRTNPASTSVPVMRPIWRKDNGPIKALKSSRICLAFLRAYPHAPQINKLVN